MTLIPSKQ